VQKQIAGVSTDYQYAASAVLREWGGNGARSYVHGRGVDEPLAVEVGASRSYYHADALGTIVAVTDEAGTIVVARDYDAWGNPRTSTAASGFAFTGREWDPEIQLHYYRSRYYDAAAGRFISEDSIGLRGGKNLFAYVGNRPSQARDPFGMCPDNKCIIYWIVVCSKCRCTSYYVPSIQCPADVETAPGEDISPKYWQCSDDQFGPDDIAEETQMTPEEVPGNGPRETPGEVAKIERDPNIKVEDIP
jgi:RHS repeat-associated protein